MTVDLGVVLCVLAAGALLGGAIFVGLLILRTECVREWKRAAEERVVLLEAVRQQRERIDEVADELRGWVASLETAKTSRPGDSKVDGRGGWSRARAIEAVRAGLTVEEASRMLNVPLREMRLVAEVVRLETTA